MKPWFSLIRGVIMQRTAIKDFALSMESTDVSQFLKAHLTVAGLRLIVTEFAGLTTEQQLTYEPEELGKMLGKVPVLRPPQVNCREAFALENKALKPMVIRVWQSVVREMGLLISTQGLEYARLRKKLKLPPKNDIGLVTMISASIGTRIGVPATILMPPVAGALLIIIASGELAGRGHSARRMFRKPAGRGAAVSHCGATRAESGGSVSRNTDRRRGARSGHLPV
jgi:hypothetical protein